MRHYVKTQLLKLFAVSILPMFAFSSLAQVQQPNAQSQSMQGQGVPSQAQMQGQAAAAPQGPPMICGNNALCQETQDFAATITSFRVSTNVYKARILDLTVRFQNKTNQQLILGYVNQSGTATDDRGNRHVPWGPNAYLGIGLVAGSNFDPRFVLSPGGWGDAQFEYVQQGSPQLIGFNFTLDFAVSEINSFEGNQHTLGGEFPLHYEGLRNGVASSAPAFTPGSMGGASSVFNAASNPCGTAGSLAQNNGSAANALANAGNAISSVTSLWHRKKQGATQNAQSVPCGGQTANTAVAPNTAQPSPSVPQTLPSAHQITVTAQPTVQAPTNVNPLMQTTTQPKVVQAAARTSSTQSTAPVRSSAATTKAAPRVATAPQSKPTPVKPGPHPPATAQQQQPAQAH